MMITNNKMSEICIDCWSEIIDYLYFADQKQLRKALECIYVDLDYTDVEMNFDKYGRSRLKDKYKKIKRLKLVFYKRAENGCMSLDNHPHLNQLLMINKTVEYASDDSCAKSYYEHIISNRIFITIKGPLLIFNSHYDLHDWWLSIRYNGIKIITCSNILTKSEK